MVVTVAAEQLLWLPNITVAAEQPHLLTGALNAHKKMQAKLRRERPDDAILCAPSYKVLF